VAPRRQGSVCPQPKISFLVHEYLGSERPISFEVSAPMRIKSTRKPCAKEVPEMDYLMQQKQYLKRTTLRRLKIPLRSICSKEGRTIALEQSMSEKAVKDKRQSTFFFTSWVSFLIPTWTVLHSLSNARKCQLEDFCEKERYESCPDQRTCTADAFRKVRKGENVPVVLLILGSASVLLLRNPCVLYQKHGGACTMY
jgi:hypothetical protein